MMRIVKWFLGWSVTIGMGFLCALFISIFIFQPMRVLGGSMEPTIPNNSKILVSKLSHTFQYEPDYGDIVVVDSRVKREHTLWDDLIDSPLYGFFKNKEDKYYYVKRVIAKAGDILEFRDGEVYRNGLLLHEPYIKEKIEQFPNQKLQIPEGTIFVLGDNRNNSRDSREIGPIPLSHIIGIKIF